jgi:hypothetical protein
MNFFTPQKNSLEEQRSPFSDNRGFKSYPQLGVSASRAHVKDHRGGGIIDRPIAYGCCLPITSSAP